MSKRAVDPVDRAFEVWRQLDLTQRDLFDQRVKGFRIAMGCEPPVPTPRKRRSKATEQALFDRESKAAGTSVGKMKEQAEGCS